MAPLAVPRASVLRVRLDAQDGVQFFRCEPQQVLQVAHEAIHVALPCRLVDDVLVVVIAQTAAQLLIVHLGLVLPLSPPAGHLRGIRTGKSSIPCANEEKGNDFPPIMTLTHAHPGQVAHYERSPEVPSVLGHMPGCVPRLVLRTEGGAGPSPTALSGTGLLRPLAQQNLVGAWVQNRGS